MASRLLGRRSQEEEAIGQEPARLRPPGSHQKSPGRLWSACTLILKKNTVIYIDTVVPYTKYMKTLLLKEVSIITVVKYDILLFSTILLAYDSYMYEYYVSVL